MSLESWSRDVGRNICPGWGGALVGGSTGVPPFFIMQTYMYASERRNDKSKKNADLWHDGTCAKQRSMEWPQWHG